MKTKSILCTICLMFICYTSFSSTKVYKSKVTPNWYSQISITMDNGAAKITRMQIEKDTSVKQCIYNVSGIEWNNGTMIFPESGVYWFIPFNNDPIEMLIEDECYACQNVYNCTSGTCAFVQAGECEICDCGSTSDQTNPCAAVSTPCEGAGGTSSNRMGGGVIIKAHTVNLSEVFYSQTLKESEICKITLSRNCPNVYF